MTKWEYKVYYIGPVEHREDQKVEDILNYLGEGGWELIYIEEFEDFAFRGIFKRPIKPEPSSSGVNAEVVQVGTERK